MPVGPLYVPFGEVSVQVLCPFFNWIAWLPGVESCAFFIYFGDQTFVCGIICKYILPYGWFPIHFADVFFRHAEAFYFDEVLSVYFSFKSFALGDISVKILFHGISEIFLPKFFFSMIN